MVLVVPKIKTPTKATFGLGFYVYLVHTIDIS